MMIVKPDHLFLTLASDASVGISRGEQLSIVENLNYTKWPCLLLLLSAPPYSTEKGDFNAIFRSSSGDNEWKNHRANGPINMRLLQTILNWLQNGTLPKICQFVQSCYVLTTLAKFQQPSCEHIVRPHIAISKPQEVNYHFYVRSVVSLFF